jgi:hypothetical protein
VSTETRQKAKEEKGKYEEPRKGEEFASPFSLLPSPFVKLSP